MIPTIAIFVIGFASFVIVIVTLGALYMMVRQGGRGWRAFGERKIIPQSFRRARICKFLRHKHRFFYDCVNIGSFWLLLKALRKQYGFR